MAIDARGNGNEECCETDDTQQFRSKRLQKLGLNLDNWDYVVALAGNPNTGKSTVFNNLTGLHVSIPAIGPAKR